MSSILSDRSDASSGDAEKSGEADDESLLLAELCDEFTRRRRTGECVTVADYAEQYPQLAGQILAVFPALAMLDGCCESHSANTSGYDDPDPVSIAGYKVIRRLGSGGMGVVYEATHPRVSRRMAIKLLRPQKSESALSQERFLREAEAASRLNHPNIVPFLDCGTDGDAVFLQTGQGSPCRMRKPSKRCGEVIDGHALCRCEEVKKARLLGAGTIPSLARLGFPRGEDLVCWDRCGWH